jgi:membrane fusion protein, multidrug efflux system
MSWKAVGPRTAAEDALRRSLLAIFVVLLVGAGAAAAYWTFVMQPAGGSGGGGATGPLAAGGGGAGRGGARGPTTVEAVEVRVAPAEVTTEAVGTLRSDESVVLKPEVTGRIAAFGFQEGRPVTAGQVMVRLDDSVERAQLAEAEAGLQLATANLERARELRRSNAGTQRALDEAQAQQLTTRAAVELAKARLAKLTLTAPFDGIAGLRRVSVGDFVTAGTEIVNVEKVQPLKVDFRVAEIFLPSLFDERGERRIGIVVDAYPGREFTGRVYAIDPLVDEQGRAIVVRAQVDNPTAPELSSAPDGAPPAAVPPTNQQREELLLRPGLFARVTLSLSQEDEALWVPEQAIVPEGQGQHVFKVVAGQTDGERVAKRTPVRLGMRQQGRAQVVEGLAPGDVVIAAGVQKVRDGAAVAVQAPPPPASPAGEGTEPAPTAGGTAPSPPPASGQGPATPGGRAVARG